MRSIKYYDFSVPSGGSRIILAEGSYFRVQSATSAINIIVEGAGEFPGMLPGQAVKDVPFKRLFLRNLSGADSTGTLLVSDSEFIDNRTYGVSSLEPATIDALHLPIQPNSTPYDATALVANTALQFLAPASNPNGAILISANCSALGAAPFAQSFIANYTTPVNVAGGTVLCMGTVSAISGTTFIASGQLSTPVYVGPNQGIWFISSISTAISNADFRACQIKIL